MLRALFIAGKVPIENFKDVPHPSSALEFGTKGISLRALKNSLKSIGGLPICR